MKKLILPLVAVSLMLFAASCSEKFKVDAPYKNVTLVYGILDMADSAHYIRIQKAFLDENKSALNMAKSADSNFYPEGQLSVVIRELDASSNVINNYTLSRVDLGTQGYTKEPGVFFTSPNYAYKFTHALNSSYTYRIVVTNSSTGEIDSAQTTVSDTSSSIFSIQLIDDPILIGAGISFDRPSASGTTLTINGSYTQPDGATAANFPGYFFQGILRFTWIDSNVSTHEYNSMSADYALGTSIASTTSGTHTSFTFTASDASLFSFLKSSLGTTAAGHQIILDTCRLIVYAGGYQLYEYEQRSAIQSTGISGSQVEPIFTNIQGKNALGLFSSEGLRTGKTIISKTTVDSIRASSLFSDNNIVGSTTFRE